MVPRWRTPLAVGQGRSFLHLAGAASCNSQGGITVRDPEKAIGAMAGKAKTVFPTYTDSQGYPATRAMLAPPERERGKVFWLTTNHIF